MADQSSTKPTDTTSGGIDQATFRTGAELCEESAMEHTLKAPPACAESGPATPEPRRDPTTPPFRESLSTSAETSDLERRVLAHERILQSLIAHMAETEPKFLARLSEKFSEPMRMARNEHDYKDADCYANEFIRAVVRLGDWTPAIPVAGPTDRRVNMSRATAQGSPGELPAALAPHLQVREHAGVWEVLVDGRFYGQYLKQEHAFAAVNALI